MSQPATTVVDTPLGTVEYAGLGAGDPVLFVHGTVDTDVAPEYSDFALARIPGAEIVRVEGGTHLAVFTDPTSGDVQARIVAFLHR